MNSWPEHPLIYEINTWVWLSEISLKYGRPITLSTVPDPEWDALAAFSFNAIWFMGVWERSPFGVQVALSNETLMADFRRALPDLAPKDVVGSPYCVRRYVVDDNFGGATGLVNARRELNRRGMRLILDFVPNHVAPDHPWTKNNPEYFIKGTEDDLQNDRASFIKIESNIIACGRDPFFPAWPDVLQLNAFNPNLRQAILNTLMNIADQCDGVRCDMAMLLINSIFEQTWGGKAGPKPTIEYWPAMIQKVKYHFPEFAFIAEAYWDMEWELQQQGFDFCYDKRLYDRLEHDSMESIKQHLNSDFNYQKKLMRFIENHDEPRASAAFNQQKELAAAVIIATIPGAKLFHEGEFEGRKIKLPVFLARRPEESIDHDLQIFYCSLMQTIKADKMLQGQWQLCQASGWTDNNSYLNIGAWCWHNSGNKTLIVVNFSATAAQARIKLPWNELKNNTWIISDALTGQIFERDGNELCSSGLYVDLGPWKYHIFSRWSATTSQS